ncbi:MAG: peptide chain release factor 2 [Candidatus Marinimicrobia bacterium]|nr:peptide chain release factor 2 [Candidatus Neomarinimicrobiota bacterium]
MLNCGGIFDLGDKNKQISTLKKMTFATNFWDNKDSAAATLKKISRLEKDIKIWEGLNQKHGDIEVLFEFLEEGESTAQEIESELNEFSGLIRDQEIKLILGNPEDIENAILTIHPGAGGTESQDWANMLYRMYNRWIEGKGFSTSILDYQAGDEAGIKELTLEIKGDFAYGQLKAEAGVHRLVRISPFDANSRRHTSFASVFVYPSIDDEIKIEINPNDLRIDTYRASGAGGQHVNKTDSAIRITHMPTGIVVQCQNERSQHKNKSQAMKVLKARLYQLEIEKERESEMKLTSQKKDIAWGSQIRSYVFHPYNMVKDHRTKEETSNVQAVMDGEIDQFIQTYLMQNMSV